MPQKLPLTPGMKYGKLTVIREIDRGKRGHRVLCACDCGKPKEAYFCDIRLGDTKSCGCIPVGGIPPLILKHGASRHGARMPEYNIWLAMKDRCHNPRCRMYPYYGARGVQVCERWRLSFTDFLSDIGPRPDPKLTLERIDNNRGYEPGNVRWASRADQVRNRRNNVFLEYGGKIKVITDWATEIGISVQTIRNRMARSLPVEVVLRPGIVR